MVELVGVWIFLVAFYGWWRMVSRMEVADPGPLNAPSWTKLSPFLLLPAAVAVALVLRLVPLPESLAFFFFVVDAFFLDCSAEKRIPQLVRVSVWCVSLRDER